MANCVRKLAQNMLSAFRYGLTPNSGRSTPDLLKLLFLSPSAILVNGLSEAIRIVRDLWTELIYAGHSLSDRCLRFQIAKAYVIVLPP